MHATEAKTCDICGRPLQEGDTVIDGKTRMGPWAFMCTTCHRAHGVGLGTGRGQRFVVGRTPVKSITTRISDNNEE